MKTDDVTVSLVRQARKEAVKAAVGLLRNLRVRCIDGYLGLDYNKCCI